MATLNVRGSWPALVTPFTEDDRIDFSVLRSLVEFHVENGSNGILLLGSTSEATLLSKDEKTKIIDEALDAARGRIPTLVGVSAPTIKEAIENTRHALEAGADGGLIVQPGYIRPSQDALYSYFKAVSEAIDLPLVIYNNPSRTGVNVEAETLARLSRLENIVALKEAGPNPYGVLRVVELTRGRFDVLCCDCPSYALVFPILASGGKGTSNVTGSIAPRELAVISKPWESYDDMIRCRETFFRYFPLMRMMYAEINPVPLKAALNMVGARVGRPRKPLQELSRDNTATLKLTMERLGILREDSYQREFFSKR
ncbi:MAG: 4-hydroxy-tetrahydrodipicolinate synthase [Candidatus Bathyarchaeota archaeon]|jgi:4-hydroxy-tetrahydrodipicolinate synthase